MAKHRGEIRSAAFADQCRSGIGQERRIAGNGKTGHFTRRRCARVLTVVHVVVLCAFSVLTAVSKSVSGRARGAFSLPCWGLREVEGLSEGEARAAGEGDHGGDLDAQLAQHT